MKIKLRQYWLPRLARLQLVLLLATLLFSWVGNLYGLQVQNLLAYEGVRWMLRNVMANFSMMPVLPLLLILMGWGMLSDSGWLDICRKLFKGDYRELTPRQRWGFKVSLIVLALVFSLLAIGFIGNEPVLLSVTGDLKASPLAEGFIFVLVLGTMLISGVYAWVSGQFRSYSDFVSSVTGGIASWSILLVNLFLLGQQIALFDYLF